MIDIFNNKYSGVCPDGVLPSGQKTVTHEPEKSQQPTVRRSPLSFSDVLNALPDALNALASFFVSGIGFLALALLALVAIALVLLAYLSILLLPIMLLLL